MENFELELKLKALNRKYMLLKKFLAEEFAETISKRLERIEKEISELKRVTDEKILQIEERLNLLEEELHERKELEKIMNKLSRRIDKSILNELDG
jgi:hypothetical protein